jgi:SAM-dependent methyltransferase
MKSALIIPVAAILFSGVGQAQERPKPEQVLQNPKLEVVLQDFPADGLILDIGGGGEGIIEQLKGKQAVAIDLSKRELDEAPGDPLLKIVMDARDLKFVDGSFPTATVFFTFMYISPGDHEKVFQEIYRVLKPGGRLLIWDAVFPQKTDERQLYVLFPLHVKLPKTEINTGYGVRLQEGQGADHLVDLAQKVGFQVGSRQDEKGWFMLYFKKPAAAPAAAPAAPAGSAAPAIVGLWNAVANSPDGDLQIRMEIKLEGGALVGSFETSDGPARLSKLDLKDDRLSFEVDYMGATYRIEAVLANDKLAGKWSAVAGPESGSFSAERKD